VPVEPPGGATDQYLPLTSAPPIYNRAKVGMVIDPAERFADYYVGTGDANDPKNVTATWHYFYGIHDKGSETAGTPDGQPMFVFRFPKPEEQNISEPAIGPGVIFVPSYVPSAADPCFGFGDSYIYALNPKTGELIPNLPDPNNPGGYVGAIKMENVGMISDLVLVGDKLYFTVYKEGVPADQGKPRSMGVIIGGSAGRVLQWRRVR